MSSAFVLLESGLISCLRFMFMALIGKWQDLTLRSYMTLRSFAG